MQADYVRHHFILKLDISFQDQIATSWMWLFYSKLRRSITDPGDTLTLWLCGDWTVVMKTLNGDRCIWQSDSNGGKSQHCFLVPRSSDLVLINICITKQKHGLACVSEMVQWISAMRANNFFFFSSQSRFIESIQLCLSWLSWCLCFCMASLVSYQYNYSISLLYNYISTAIVFNSNFYVWL